MKKISFLLLLLALIVPSAAYAEFESWSCETEEDPFSGGKNVSAINLDSLRSGVIILCDGAKKQITIRSIPGYSFSQELYLITPTMKIATDGKIILTDIAAKAGFVGDNMAASEARLTDEEAEKFVQAFRRAGRQVAIQDGISDKPQLLSAAGAAKTGAALARCIL